MQTRSIHVHPRARRDTFGLVRTAGALVHAGVLIAASLLAQPALRAPAAAQVSRPPATRCVAPPNGLTFWLPFDHSFTDIVAGLNGTAVGASFVAGPPARGTALGVTGPGRVDYPPSPATSVGMRDFSVDAWIRLPQTPGVNTLLDNRLGNQNTSLTGFGLFVHNGNIGFQMADGGWTNFISGHNVADNRWHFVVVTVARRPKGGYIYVDGVPVYNFNAALRPGSLGINNHLAIGHDLNNNQQGSAFEIDEVEIIKRVLTPSEVAALFHYPKCRRPHDNRP